MSKPVAFKTFLINISKLVIVFVLLAWMVSTGKLNVHEMKIFLTNPSIIVSAIAVWFLGPVLIGSWRWWLLIKGAGLQCKFLRAVQLQMIGFFFNTAMPGAVGGDIVKAIYIVRDQSVRSGKTPAMLSVLLDRIVGLIGLFVMGAIAGLLNLNAMLSHSTTMKLMQGVALIVFSSCIFLGFVLAPYRDGADPFERFLARQWPGFSVIRGIYRALRSYRHRPGTLFATIGLSIVIQTIFMGFMGYVGVQMYPQDFDIALLPPVFPFGVLVTAVPLAPGGLGVGHAAFDKLFSMVGLPGGANVFNIFALSQLAMNLLCFVPYLSLKKKQPIDLDDQELLAESEELPIQS